jgi:ribose transport system substrate-binding protein
MIKLIRSTATILSAFLCLYGASCHAAEPVKIALIMKDMGNEFFQGMAAGAKTHQLQHRADYQLNVSGITDETDRSGQIALIKTATSERVDAIVIAPVDSEALMPYLQTAIQSGIVVINIDNKLDDRLLIAAELNIPFLGPSNKAGAKLAGDFLAKQLKSGDQVAIIEGISSATNAKSRTQGFTQAMEQAGIQVVAVRSGQWETEDAATVAHALLKEHPQLKALLCGNDNMAIGAIQTVSKEGLEGRVLIIGYDNIPAIKPLLQSGQLLATVDQFGEQQAVFAIELALQALRDNIPQDQLEPMQQTPTKLISR